MTPYWRKVTAVFAGLALLAVALVWLLGCNATFDPPPQFPPASAAPEAAPSATATLDATKAVTKPLGAATQRAAKLTPANLPTQKPSLLDELSASWQAAIIASNTAAASKTRAEQTDAAAVRLLVDVRERDGALAKATETITAQNGTIADLRQELADYKRNVVTWVLRGLLALCGIACMGGIYLLVKMDFWNGGALLATGVAGGALFMFAIRLQDEVVIAVCIALALAVIVFAYLAYRRLHEGKKSIVDANQVGIATGAISLEKMAPIYDAVETKYAKTFVDSNTPKKRRVRTPHHLFKTANGPESVSPKPTAAMPTK